jgi:riboflavin kinase/FMN adenylyltransferase
MCGEEKISTTLVKACLEDGNVKKAALLLGSPYHVTGTVIVGMGRGKELGFPTANLTYPENKVEVKFGVYKVTATIDEKDYIGIANYGARPTFGEEGAVLEVYFDGFEGDLYGKDITVNFVDYLRDIVPFENEDELKAQLTSDLAKVKEEA